MIKKYYEVFRILCCTKNKRVGNTMSWHLAQEIQTTKLKFIKNDCPLLRAVVFHSANAKDLLRT